MNLTYGFINCLVTDVNKTSVDFTPDNGTPVYNKDKGILVCVGFGKTVIILCAHKNTNNLLSMQSMVYIFFWLHKTIPTKNSDKFQSGCDSGVKANPRNC